MSPLAGWARRHPRAALCARTALTAVLLGLVTLEGILLARQPTFPHAVVWTSGLLVCLSAVPWPGLSLTLRAAFAAATTWTTTLILILTNRPLVVWGIGEAAALLVLLSSVLLRAPTRTAAVLGPLLGLGCMAVPVRDIDPGRFSLLFSVLTVVVGGYSLLLRVQAAQRVRDLHAVRTAERLELARELHDLVAHHVTGIVVEARAARFTQVAADPDPARTDAILARIERAGDEALGSMRRLVKVLREEDAPAGTAPVAGLQELRELTERFSATGPPVVLTIENGLDDRLPAEIAATAHRIVLEALTNIAKHAAGATAVRIGLRTVPAGLELRITDDGGHPARLSDQARGGGYGLAGMTERAEAMGGTLTAGPTPEGGWTVTAVLPLG
ncbi:two-component sensor histidine kinase [Streptomyces venezuelae]|uniref:histidine kinase n=1 Tax=Streptomyces venezuelae TaxID=54571 RepID=A0A5P2DBK1_STRVZ|nr:histidine kinase [Streptomyces venezuelae]QES50641.1 two-component sensor histidine kinase [Streptomyces venezuelae]